MKTVRILVGLAAIFVVVFAIGTMRVAAQGQAASGPVDMGHGLDQWGRRPGPHCSCTFSCRRVQRWCPCRSGRPGHCPCGWRTRCIGGWQRRCWCGRLITPLRPPVMPPTHPWPHTGPDPRPWPRLEPNPPRPGPGPEPPGPPRRRWEQPNPPASGPPPSRRRDFVAPGLPPQQPGPSGGAAPGRLPDSR